MTLDKTKTVTIRTGEENIEFLSEEFKNTNTGFNECVAIVKAINDAGIDPDKNKMLEALSLLAQIRKRSAYEIKEIFTSVEKNFFFDCFNGIMIDPALRCSADVVIIQLQDAELYNSTATKWGVSLDVIEGKIKGLTGAQVDAFYTLIENLSN